MVQFRQSNSVSFMPEAKEASVANVGIGEGYPFIDKGQLAMMRSKPAPFPKQDKYIENFANQMIKEEPFEIAKGKSWSQKSDVH